jgi:uncharacterized protein YgiM (DUF1202 family)
MKNIFFLTAAWLIILIMPVLASTASIGKDKVNVRKEPNLRAEVLFQAHLGYPVELAGTKGEWVKIKDWQNEVGWVYGPMINKQIQTAVVLPENGNIRKGPGLKYPVVAQVKNGEVYRIFQERSGWVKIGYYVEDQVLGWIRNDLVWGD